MDEKGATHIFEATPYPIVETEDDTSRSMYLVLLSGGIPGAMLPLVRGGNWLGRAADNSLQLPDPSVSRHHALLKADEDGQVRLTDLGSTNGTFVNGERLTPKVPVALNDGDRLRIGTTVVVKFLRPDPCEEQFQREMFERTVRDGLTGLYNRSYFLDQMDILAQKAANRGMGMSVLMLDIDHFKRVNDDFGHSMGDAVLREVADVLRSATRSEDLVARYGGEEFILALPIISPRRALERAEWIRRCLASRPLRTNREPLRITASIGLIFTPASRPRPASALISAADYNLYRAKEAGRDRVVFLAEPEPPLDSQLTADGEVTPTSFISGQGTLDEIARTGS